MRVLVVDDEPLARRRLIRMLAKLDGVELAGEAADGIEALERVTRDRPDVLLLDIRMPGLDGLSLAAHGDLPPIIFTTAFDEHALRAFEVSAVDYLLKPVKLERLRAALAKVRASPRGDAEALRALVERLTPREVAPIAARSGTSVRLFDPRAIARFRAEDKYCVFRHEGREYLLDESLAALEARLGALGFVRVHRAELVNLHCVRALHARDEDTQLELTDGQTAQVSRRLVPELRRRLGIG